MTTGSKPQPNATSTGSSLFRVAIVGGTTLKGKEVIEALDERKFPSLDVKLLDDDESLGQLEAVGDEMTFIQRVRAEQFERIDFTFFASDPRTTKESWALAQQAGSAIVDASYALEDDAAARVRSPWVERQRGQDLQLELQPGPAVIAHPIAVIVALLVLRAGKAGEIKRVVATAFEPVSEQGQKGVDELHEQTINLLSFQEIPQSVFATQVAFNLVKRYGEEAVASIETVERRIAKHYQRIAGKGAPVPALTVMQAPIFHGHAVALYLETAEPVALGDMTQAVQGEHVEIARTADDSPTNVRAAGQADILVSIARDANQEKGFWIWATADNLRVAARNAVECAESLAASRPRGKVQ